MTTTTEAPPPVRAPTRRDARSDTVVAVSVPTVLVAAHMWLYGRWIVDDAGITMAYARSISSGLGPVLQPGAPMSEGWSDPSWLALLLGARWLGLLDHGAWFGVPDLVAFPKAVGLLCCAGMFLAFHRVAVRVSSNPLTTTVVAGSITAAIPSFVVWIGGGLENPLLALVVVLLAARIATAAVDGRLLSSQVALQCAGLAALTSLTRPDGAVYLVAYPLAAWMLGASRRWWRPAGLALLVGVLPALVYEVWRFATFGELVPTTAIAKRQGLLSSLQVAGPANLIAVAGWPAALLVTGALAVVLARRRSMPDLTRAVYALLILLGLAVLAFALLAADWMALARFATPVWPLGALLAVLVLAPVLGGVGSRRLRAATGVMVLALGVSLVGWVQAALSFQESPTLPLCTVVRTNALVASADADALGVRSGSFLGADAGGMALASRLRFIDLAGLTDPTIARFWAAGDMQGLRDHIFVQARPTFMRLARGWSFTEFSGLLDDPRVARDYVQLWTDGRGGVTLVRRDAVPSEAVLRAAAFSSSNLMDTVNTTATAGGTGWQCPDALRPPPVGAAAAVLVRGAS